MDRTLKVGIVGAHWGVDMHLPALRAIPDMEVVAICTAHEETARAASTKNDIPKAYWDFDKFLSDDELDVVVISTRPKVRRDMIVPALERGKHVITDAAFAVNLDYAQSYSETAQKYDCKTLIIYEPQWTPGVQKMIELVNSDYLGTPYMAHAELIFSCFNPIHAKWDGYLWLADAENGGNTLRNFGTHVLDPLRRMFGEVTDVAGVQENFHKQARFSDGSPPLSVSSVDTAAFFARFDTNVIATVNVGWSQTHSAGFVVDAYGSNGRLVVKAPAFPYPRSVQLYGGQGDDPLEEIPVSLAPNLERVRQERNLPELSATTAVGVERLAQAIRSGGEARPNFEDGYHITRAVDAVERSPATRQWIRLGAN